MTRTTPWYSIRAAALLSLMNRFTTRRPADMVALSAAMFPPAAHSRLSMRFFWQPAQKANTQRDFFGSWHKKLTLSGEFFSPAAYWRRSLRFVSRRRQIDGTQRYMVLTGDKSTPLNAICPPPAWFPAISYHIVATRARQDALQPGTWSEYDQLVDVTDRCAEHQRVDETKPFFWP